MDFNIFSLLLVKLLSIIDITSTK